MSALDILQRYIEYHREKKRVHIDQSVLFLFPFAAAIICTLFPVDTLMAILLFYGVPSVYLSYRYPLYVKKIFLFASLFGLPATLIIDYMAHVSLSWVVNSHYYRVLGQVPLDDFLWGFLIVYLVTFHYKVFSDLHLRDHYSSGHRYFFAFLVVVLSLFVFAYLFFPELLRVPYYYLSLGIFLIVVPIAILHKSNHMLLRKFVKTGIFFTVLVVLHEIVALNAGHWYFPPKGEYIHVFNFFGNRLPLEEVVFWFITFSYAILSYFEFFDDDVR